MIYSTEERVEILYLRFYNRDCARAWDRIVNEHHPEGNASHNLYNEVFGVVVFG